jgi:hypothetical protein
MAAQTDGHRMLRDVRGYAPIAQLRPIAQVSAFADARHRCATWRMMRFISP